MRILLLTWFLLAATVTSAQLRVENADHLRPGPPGRSLFPFSGLAGAAGAAALPEAVFASHPPTLQGALLAARPHLAFFCRLEINESAGGVSPARFRLGGHRYWQDDLLSRE